MPQKYPHIMRITNSRIVKGFTIEGFLYVQCP
jgi:hypothetical protein